MVEVTFTNVTKRYPAPSRNAPETTAVDNVSLSIPSGSLFFLLGPSGCGKTTLLRMVAGFIQPSEGSISFDRLDMAKVPPYRRDTGMVFQSYALWPHMTVGENVAFGLDVRKTGEPRRSQRIDKALDTVQMLHLKDRKPNQLSGGQQQRVALARALAIHPKCLLLDEPLSNLDARLRLEMRSEIRRIVKQTGITALYVTHDQKEALSMADGIALMNAGKLEQTGSPTDLYRRPASRFAADFIGETNFLPATIASINSSSLTLQTPAGPLLAALPSKHNGSTPTFTPGQTLTAAFRPESLSLASASATADPALNRLPARRISTTYLGEAAEHLLELAGKLQVKALDPNPSPESLALAHPGDAVTLLLAPQNIMLIP
jgi:iron(III) transport system ATP-binding protein